MKVIGLFLISLLFISLFIGCKNSNSNSSTIDNSENIEVVKNNYSTQPDISSLSCDDLMYLVMDNGYRIQSLDASDMNSSALDYIALYEYEDTYYTVVEFTSSSKKYIYCDVSRSDWDNFVDNDLDSYGESFDEYLNKSSCNCN